jgi:hypothetical protein
MNLDCSILEAKNSRLGFNATNKIHIIISKRHKNVSSLKVIDCEEELILA